MIFQVKAGEKNEFRTLALSSTSIRLISSTFESFDEFEYAWPRRIEDEIRYEIDFNDIKSIQKKNNEKTYDLITHGNYDLDNEIPILFLDANEEILFRETVETKLSFEKIERKLNADEAAQKNLLLLAGSILFTAVFYFAIGYLENRIQTSPTSFRRGNLLFSILQYIGQGGTLKIGGFLSLLFGFGAYQQYKNPPSVEEWLFRR